MARNFHTRLVIWENLPPICHLSQWIVSDICTCSRISMTSRKVSWLLFRVIICEGRYDLFNRILGKLKTFIDDLHSGKLHRVFHYGFDPNESTPATIDAAS